MLSWCKSSQTERWARFSNWRCGIEQLLHIWCQWYDQHNHDHNHDGEHNEYWKGWWRGWSYQKWARFSNWKCGIEQLLDIVIKIIWWSDDGHIMILWWSDGDYMMITFPCLTPPWSQLSLWQISDHLEQNIWWDNLLSILSKITGGPFQRYILMKNSNPEQNYFKTDSYNLFLAKSLRIVKCL